MTRRGKAYNIAIIGILGAFRFFPLGRLFRLFT